MQADLIQLMQLTLHNPRAAARRLIGWQLPFSGSWALVALTAVISAILSSVALLIAPAVPDQGALDPQLLALFANPLQVAVLQALVMVVMAMLAQGVGRMFGGSGRFTDALILIAWTEALLCLLQLLNTVVMLALPSLSAALGLFGILLFIWVLTNFIAELHGFASVGKVLFGIFATLFAVSFVMAVVMVVLVGRTV